MGMRILLRFGVWMKIFPLLYCLLLSLLVGKVVCYPSYLGSWECFIFPYSLILSFFIKKSCFLQIENVLATRSLITVVIRLRVLLQSLLFENLVQLLVPSQSLVSWYVHCYLIRVFCHLVQEKLYVFLVQYHVGVWGFEPCLMNNSKYIP